MRLGVVVPCRNEAAVIERRLRNLACCAWPAGAHRVVVVDDGSSDGTAELARACALPEDVELCVVANRERPGKPGAVTTGIDALGDVDLVVLTDADVVSDPGALVALASAFERESELSLACASQRFVPSLSDDGSVPEAVERSSPASNPYDRITALVRRVESRCGRLFSLHGQLCAWRASLGLRPSPGVAADDLDLVLSLRDRDGMHRIRMLAEATFCETKPGAKSGQALRRARAYVQALARPRPRCADLAWRAQWLIYRYVPASAPAIALVVALLAVVLASAFAGLAGALVALTVLSAFALTLPGRRLVRFLFLIREAARREAREDLPESWEMARR